MPSPSIKRRRRLLNRVEAPTVDLEIVEQPEDNRKKVDYELEITPAEQISLQLEENVARSSDWVETISDIHFLSLVKDIERSNKNRLGVLRVIKEQMHKLMEQ